MASLAAANSVIAGQQEYAATKDISTLFETLTVAVLSSKPAEPLAFLHAQLEEIAARSGAAKAPTSTGKNIDTEQGAATYLESSGVQDLLETMLTQALVAKPANPAKFLADVCATRMEAAKNGLPAPSFFTDDDLKGVHSLFDATHNNSITAEQARAALKSLGLGANGVPVTGDLDVAAFVAVARANMTK